MDVPVELLGRLTRVLATQPGATLTERICRAFAVLVGADGAAITLEGTSGLLLFATGPDAERLEDLQSLAQEGPSIQARTGGATVVVRDDAQVAEQWPTLAETLAADAADHRFPAIHAFPMQPEDVVIGVLTTYARRGRTLDLELESAQWLANSVGVALLGALRPGQAGASAASRSSPTPGPPEVLTDATVLDDEPWSVRDTISQATGMVVAQLRVPAPDALAVLRAHAYAENTTLSALSRRVTRRQTRFTDPQDAT